ncbi:cation transporter [Clostridium sp. DSM 17811]|nr:cation transporter [Clostridium sp. DSM 17811]
MAVGKILVGIFSLSFFLCINAFYNIAMGMAKTIFIKEYYDGKKEPDEEHPDGYGKGEYHCYYLGGIIVLISSIVYMVYCIRMFVSGDSVKYSMIVSLAIAVFTFTELGVSIQGAIVTRRDKEPVIEAIKLTNLASSMISLVLTQTAIMSFSYDGDASFYNGMSGMILGSASAILGLYMIIYIQRIMLGKNHASVLRKANKIAKKCAPGFFFEAIKYEDNGPSTRKIYVRTTEQYSEEFYEKVQYEIKSRLHIDVIRVL